MNKEISKSPKKHEFLLNFAKSPPLSVDHYDFSSMQPHSKDSVNEPEDQLSFHRDVLTTTTDHLSVKNLGGSSNSTHNRKSHTKKRSFDLQKDSVTTQLITPSHTATAKILSKPLQTRTMNRSSTTQHMNFLNSKEFAKFALSKVLPKDTKKERMVNVELSPQNKRSKPTSVEKHSPKVYLKEEFTSNTSSHPKLSSHLQSKKQHKVKPRASNLTYNDFSSILDQSRLIHSFMNSPQRRGNLQISLPSTKSTSNLRPMSTKNSNSTTKNAWLHNSNEVTKGPSDLNTLKKQQQENVPHEDNKHKERNKGMHSIASILNLRRDKKLSPDKNVNSWYPASHYHRKVASIGGGGQNCAYSFNNSMNQSHYTQNQTPHVISTQEDNKHSNQRSPSHHTQKPYSSPSKKGLSPPKRDDTDEGKDTTDRHKDSQIDHFNGLKLTFENLLEKYKLDIENAQEGYNILRRIKQAYEGFITDLLANQNNGKEISQLILSGDKELKMKFEILLKDKILLEDEVNQLRAENHKLQNIIGDSRNSDGGRRSLESGVEMLNRAVDKGSEEIIEELLINKYDCPTEKANSDHENLKRLVVNQQNIINTYKRKDLKMSILLEVLKRQGIDVEKVYKDELKMSFENSRVEDPVNSSGRVNLDTSQNHTEGDHGNTSHQAEILSLTAGELSDIMPDSRDFKPGKTTSDAKSTTDSTPFTAGGNKSIHTAINTMLKSKLKLDFTALPHNHKMRRVPLGNIIEYQQDHIEPIGFHDESMARIGEFSLSWRQAALNQRNI